MIDFIILVGSILVKGLAIGVMLASCAAIYYVESNKA